MKKLKLQFGDVKEMLTKDQMKLIRGGDIYCGALGADGNYDPNNVASVHVFSDDCVAAQSAADSQAWYGSDAASFPYGADCNC